MALSEEKRREAVKQALANLRLSGFEPEPEFEALLEQYVIGALSLDDIREAAEKIFGWPPAAGN